MSKYLLLSFFAVLLVSCGKQTPKLPQTSKDAKLAPVLEDVAKKKSQLEELHTKLSRLNRFDQQYLHLRRQTESLAHYIQSMEMKVIEKREQGSLSAVNERNMAKAMQGHTNIYPFKGTYKVMVIPVQFSDVKFTNPHFFNAAADGKIPAQDYLFGKNAKSMSQYYKHASLGKLNVTGEVTPMVTVSGSLNDYGESVHGSSDKNARGLVADALTALKEQKSDPSWWEQFDAWDLSDYDFDQNFHEPDGFVDAVVFIYAGKSQASCQRSFDADGTRPASVDVPAGPRHDAAVECFNRLWPHRWSLALSASDPRYSPVGPIVEGLQRPSMGGLRISDTLFANDYNMQSEYSDLSTFMHEFGHSLSLPDVYSSGKSNSTGQWELMSNNARLQAQEFSSYSKLSLGWLNPKIILQGETTSAYLGAYNFVSKNQRDNLGQFTGPNLVEQYINDKKFNFNILSEVPEFEEPVYRSIVALTEPTPEDILVVDPPTYTGNQMAYSGRFDGEIRSLKMSFKVPEQGPAVLTFDTYYHVETLTNFNSPDDQIEVKVDYDLGRVLINGELKEELRLISGDDNYDTLNENNPLCEGNRVLELRKKMITGTLTDDDKIEFGQKLKICRTPTWVKKSYDLSSLRGQLVDVEIQLQTDDGYTELGLVVDNIKLGDKTVDFENASDLQFGKFIKLSAGKYQEFHNQFYLFEYRTPGEKYLRSGKEISYNMDNNISPGNQSFFLEQGNNLADQFRMVTFDYQPGVLVWYYNSKYGRTTNDPALHNGKGYLLVLNSKVKELGLPGIWDNPDLKDESGVYKRESKQLKDLVKSQYEKFICFSHTKYQTYISGETPACDDPQTLDYMTNLSFQGKKLIYRRENFNEVLPINQYQNFGVGKPFRNDTPIRTGLSTFRPKDSEEFAPFKVYKEKNGTMVLDKLLTESAPKFKAVASFDDTQSVFAENEQFQGDTVVVEKKGLSFHVMQPGQRILNLYSKTANEDEQNFYLRRPRAKVYFVWKQL